MVAATQAIEGTIRTTTLDAHTARQLTTEINTHAELLREKLLRFYEGAGWLAMGYASFQTWAEAECVFSWQHVYKLVAVARVEENLTLLEGETLLIPVNHGKHLAKLPSPALQLEAYTLARDKAATIQQEATEQHIIDAVKVVQKREFVRQSPHKVVAQMVATDELSAKDGVRLAKWLDAVPPETQVYVQEKMAAGIRNMLILHKLVNRHRQFIRTGAVSYNLEEIEQTKRIGGKPLTEANEVDWNRMAEQNQAQRLSEERAAKQAAMEAQALATGEPLPLVVEPVPMNAYTNSPEKTLQALERVLDDKTLDGLFELMAQKRGYVWQRVVPKT